MTTDEFWKAGLVQEVNRRLLHPLGIALSAHIRGGQCVDLSIVSTDDPEGMIFGTIWDKPDNTAGRAVTMHEAAGAFDELWAAAEAHRLPALGYMVEPVPPVKEGP